MIPTWIFLSCLTVLGSLIGIIYWALVSEINRLRTWRHEIYPADIARLQLLVTSTRDEVIKLQENRRLTELEVKMEQAEKFIVELRLMKHERVDAYLPRAFDELHARVQRLEQR